VGHTELISNSFSCQIGQLINHASPTPPTTSWNRFAMTRYNFASCETSAAAAAAKCGMQQMLLQFHYYTHTHKIFFNYALCVSTHQKCILKT